jgi:drug/metabolite transporter (DMT)-like permease
MNLKPRIKGIIFVILGATLWGVSGSVAQFLFKTKGFNTEWLVTIRLLASGILLLIYSYSKSKSDIFKVWRDKGTALGLIVFSLVGMLGSQYTYFAAINHGNAATATILQYLSPVFITVYMIVKNRKLPSIKQIGAIALAMLGTFFIITNGNINEINISKSALFWGIAAGITAAFYTLQPKKLLAEFGSILLVGWGMLIGGISFSFIHAPWNFQGEWTTSSFLGVFFVVIFGTLIAYNCYLNSLKYIEPTEASILSSSEPLSAAFLSVIWLKEVLGLAQWIGTLCIIITIVILSKAKSKTSES